MKPSILLDEDVHFPLAHALRARGFEALHTQEVERKGRSDEDQLEYAASQQRCLVTFNIKDFVLLHNQYFATGRQHWGVIVSKQLPVGEALRRLLQILSTLSSDDLKNRIEFL